MTEKKSNVATAVAKAGKLGIKGLVEAKSQQDRFITMYQASQGRDDGSSFYQVEKFHFLKLVNESDKLKKCDPISLMGVFMDASVNGLSFDPSMGHVSVVPYGETAKLMISGIGELLMRQNMGQIKYADNPIIAYDCDALEYGSDRHGAFVNHSASGVRPESAKGVLCYLRITRPDGSVDYKWLTYQDLMQIKKFSKQPNSPAWGLGEAGMWASKTIKHAFKNYPKLRKGSNSTFEGETDVPDIPRAVIPETPTTIPEPTKVADENVTVEPTTENKSNLGTINFDEE